MKVWLAALAVITACGCANTDARVDRIVTDAQLELRRGQVAAAQQLVDQGVSLTERAPDSLAARRIQLLRAEVALARLEIPAALKDLEAPLPAGDEFNQLRARQKYLQGQAQITRGQLQPALETLDAAAAMAEGDPVLQLDIEVMGSQARLRLGRWDDAEQRLNKVVATAAERGDRFREALAINNLGMSRLVRNRCDDALSRFERVLSFNDLEQTRIYAAALNNTGICLARLGEYDRALALQQRAVDSYERSGRRLELMTALGELGTTYLLRESINREEIKKGLPYLQRALDIANEAGLAADGSLWARNLAAAHLILENWDEAERFNAEARRLNPTNRRERPHNTATDAQIAAARGQHREAAALYARALASAKDEPSTQWKVYEGLAKLAIAEQKPQAAAANFEAALTTVERTRSALLKADYRLSFLTRLMSFYQLYVGFLTDRGDIERALEVADSSRGRVLAEGLGVAAPHGSTVKVFRQLAKQTDQVFVVYWLSPSRSLAWVISAGGVRSVPLAPRSEIEPLVQQYHAQLQNTSVDPLEKAGGAGDQLYARVVAPLAAWLPRNAKLVIVPDGALHRLNFETLPVRSGSTAHYWIEDVTIQVAPALSMMTAAPKASSASRPLLLVGNPTPRAPDFPALSYATAEMDGVSKPFGKDNVTVLQSDQASPAAFRGAKPEQFSRIHFTTHAIANTDSPMDSAVILSGSDTAFKLYARDVAEMPLAADLVTVSACRSAGDRAYSGEGLVGFAWAFLRAGSRRVVAGLWDVDDRSTAALMSDFYARLAVGDAAPAALRTAKLGLLREQKMRPYYWAPLQMFTAEP
jgi:CHAT domain-containing protein/tetratricopeptide (TPR) repeat protein